MELINRKCLLCGSDKFRIVHNGTRDNATIDVMKCENCGLVTLSEFPRNVESMYQNGEMHINTFDIKEDKFTNIDFERWIENTAADDDRRFEHFKEMCRGKRILEFGCGNGGFLRRISGVADCAVGVELDSVAVKK